MGDIERYIVEFLLYGNSEAVSQVGYTANEEEWSHYKVVIVPSGHLRHDLVRPDLGRVEIEKRERIVPDESKEPITNNQSPITIIKTDIIYNTFFFISRAEELLTDERDEHGRFAARYSMLGRKNRLQIPLIDEYARILMKALELDLPAPGFSHIYLTHDVDTIAHYRHLRGFIGGLLRGQGRRTWAAQKDIRRDPAYTFPWLIKQDSKLVESQESKVDSIYFIKHTRGRGYDYPQYDLRKRDYRYLEHELTASGAKLGLHSSYYGEIIDPMPLHRSHYLRCSIDQMQRLADAGITDDFTIGFPDAAGFRLQTTRPVRWINPKTYTLTSLTLHPLTVMDVTLSNAGYMHLSEDEAYFLCQQLFDKIRQYQGEAVLLWHNSNIGSGTYHRDLYPKLLQLLQ